MKEPKIRKRCALADGTSLSVQASRYHYSTPRNDEGPHSSVEVGFIEDGQGKPMTPPIEWADYAEGGYPSDVYAYVPVSVVQKFISEHGGIVSGEIPDGVLS